MELKHLIITPQSQIEVSFNRTNMELKLPLLWI